MNAIKEIFSAYLNQLRQDIVLFASDDNIWKTSGNITNPAGTLTLHICGNLKHYIGNVIGNIKYQRDRDAEFTSRVTKDKLLEEIDSTRDIIIPVLEKLREEDLIKSLQCNSPEQDSAVLSILIKIATHAAYHTGQVNYLRRTLEE
jgi:hypothetical protein